VTSVVVLAPPVRRLDTPPCEAIISDSGTGWGQYYYEQRAKRANARGRKPFQCERLSRYKIDDKCYCSIHAGAKALEILLKQAGNP